MFKQALIAVSAIAVAASLAATPVFADDEYNVSSGFTAKGAPLGFHGVDPVAFVNLGSRIQGAAKYALVNDGVTYYFADETNMKAFEANPAAYMPQYGGFCTFGVSVGKKFDGNPRFAVVREGKLYAFLSQDILEAFLQDEKGTFKKAAKNWKEIHHTAAADL